MTKIEELEQRLEVMEKVAKAYGIFKEEVERLQKALAELKESKKEGKWEPQVGEEYYYRDSDGDDACTYWYNDDANHWRTNNLPIFKTKEEYERYWQFMDTVKEKSYEFSKEEWTNKTIAKYIIQYDYLREYFYVDKYSHVYTLGTIYFKTKESAQYIIDNFKDELMEYFV